MSLDELAARAGYSVFHFCRLFQIATGHAPKEYIRKYSIDNLLWYPLPNAWRLVYSVFSNEGELIVMIVEYFDHKEYERRFGY